VLRHGESEGNAAGTFAGWRDVPLTALGRAQAIAAAAALQRWAIRFDALFTSRLTRTVETADLVVRALAIRDIARCADWRLNERHIGALQGRSKDDCRREYGRDWLHALRTVWDFRPPLASAAGPDDPRRDPAYADVREPLPRGESFADLAVRTAAVWQHELAPRLRAGQSILVVGHGIALRALARPFEGITADQLPPWALGNASPRAWHFDDRLRVTGGYAADRDGDGTDE
jgi:2,3-bisphosphoglycerate-dependent phosphoglycerate mutase